MPTMGIGVTEEVQIIVFKAWGSTLSSAKPLSPSPTRPVRSLHRRLAVGLSPQYPKYCRKPAPLSNLRYRRLRQSRFHERLPLSCRRVEFREAAVRHT